MIMIMSFYFNIIFIFVLLIKYLSLSNRNSIFVKLICFFLNINIVIIN